MNCFEQYEKYKDLFDDYFKENAEEYWQMYKEYFTGNYTYQTLSEKYFYSEETIKRIIRKVKDFFENPLGKVSQLDYIISDLKGSVMLHKEFIEGQGYLSLNANKLLLESIYLYQNGMSLRNPRSRIIDLGRQYVNVSRRAELFDELRNLEIRLPKGNCIKVYEMIEDEKGVMKFVFTEDALCYIDPLYTLIMQLDMRLVK